MFRVAASLDSMILGEPQILGQMKQAYAAARGEGVVGGLLESVLTKRVQAAKRVRSETGIGQMAVSVSYAAVELARKIFGNLSAKSDHDYRGAARCRSWRCGICGAPDWLTFSSPTGRISAPSRLAQAVQRHGRSITRAS